MALKLNKQALTKFQEPSQESFTHCILVVDDEPQNLNSIRRALEHEFRVLTANDGKEALEMILGMEQPQKVHLIISDQRMPGLTGVEFLAQTIPIMPESVRMILTGYTDIQAIIDAVNESNIYKFLTKPIEPEDLRLTVRRALEAFELEEKNRKLTQELQAINQGLEEKVQERTTAIRDLLDNTGQGFLSFGPDYRVHPEYSQSCGQLLGPGFADQDPLELLFLDKAPEVKAVTQSLFAQEVQLEVIRDLLPKEVENTRGCLQLEYHLIAPRQKEPLRIMLVVTDITRQRQLEKTLKRSEDRKKLLAAVATNKEQFIQMVQEVKENLAQVPSILEQSPPQAQAWLFRTFHSIKGNAANFHLDGVAELAHQVENLFRLDQGQEWPPLAATALLQHVEMLHKELRDVFNQVSEIIPLEEWRQQSGQSYKVPLEKLSRLEEATRRYPQDQKLQEATQALRLEPLTPLLQRLCVEAEHLADSLGKKLVASHQGGALEVDFSRWKEVFFTLVHLVRNGVDHGMESPEERQAKGKPGVGKISLFAALDSGQLVLRFADDGRGIQADKLCQAALSKGVISREQGESWSEEELLQLVFHPGLSTKAEVSRLSGRGVGLDAVKTAVEKLGGQIQAENLPAGGACFSLRLPLA